MHPITLLVITTWLTGSPNSQTMEVTPVPEIVTCKALAKQVTTLMDHEGRYVQAYCLDSKGTISGAAHAPADHP